MSRVRPPRAYSMLEVLMASTLLAVGASGIFMGMTAVFRSDGRLRKFTVASQVAESAAEVILSLPPQHPWLEDGAHAGPGETLYFDATGAPCAPSAGRFVVTWRVDANRTGGANLQGMRRVDVDVAWQHAGETRHTEWRLHRR